MHTTVVIVSPFHKFETPNSLCSLAKECHLDAAHNLAEYTHQTMIMLVWLNYMQYTQTSTPTMTRPLDTQ